MKILSIEKMTLKEMLISFLVKILIIYVIMIVGVFLYQRSMIYFPDKTRPDLEAYGASKYMEEVNVKTKDGLPLNGWYAPPKKRGKPVIIHFHGNAGNYGGRFFVTYPYILAGYGVLLTEYRGYGGNPGKISEKGFYTDARTWIDALLAGGAEQENLVFYGESIGTGVAAQMATEYKDVRAVILESPYTSLGDLGASVYPFLPVRTLILDKFKTINKINQVKAPLLIIRGNKDETVPPEHGMEIFRNANKPKELKNFPEYGHNDMPVEERAQTVMEFIEKY